MKKYEAVTACLEGKTGYKSSLEQLRKDASRLWCRANNRDINDAAITDVYCSAIRSKWKIENEIVSDQRTHRDTPRRNMLNDIRIDRTIFNAFVERWEDYDNDEIREELALLADLHSIDQLRNIYLHIIRRRDLVVEEETLLMN